MDNREMNRLIDLLGRSLFMLDYRDDYGNVQSNGNIEHGEMSEELDHYEIDVDGIKSKWDTSALDVSKGRDLQGIPWENMKFTRSQYREQRLKQYKNYTNLNNSFDEIKKECRRVEKGSKFYDFKYNTRLVKPTIMHFQLRNLVKATSKHDAYLISSYSIKHWSSLRRTGREVLNVASRISFNKGICGSKAPAMWWVRATTMCVEGDLLAVGGSKGELICKNLNHRGVTFCSKITANEDAMTNSVDIFRNPSSTRLITANNDHHVRTFDAESFKLLSDFEFPWPVNNASISPNGTVLSVLGDSTDSILVDSRSGKTVGILRGHLDYSFTSAWHPEGRLLATGNQDGTCRLWDVRNLSRSFAVLGGRLAAIRTIKFSSDGRFMAAAEAADFVHVFDRRSCFRKAQEIDIFGEIAGVSFSPDTEALFVGVSDHILSSLLEFKRMRVHRYGDSYF